MGDQILGGVRFLIAEQENKVNTQCGGPFSDWPTEFVVPLDDIARPETIYILMNAGRTTGSPSKQIGVIGVDFADGRSLSYDLVLGENIREWRFQAEGTVGTASSLDLIEVYHGPSDHGDAAVLDMLKLNIPEGYRDGLLASIIIRDISQGTLGSADPCLFFVGLTVRAR